MAKLRAPSSVAAAGTVCTNKCSACRALRDCPSITPHHACIHCWRCTCVSSTSVYVATLLSKPTKQQASTAAAEVYHCMKYIIKALPQQQKSVMCNVSMRSAGPQITGCSQPHLQQSRLFQTHLSQSCLHKLNSFCRNSPTKQPLFQ